MKFDNEETTVKIQIQKRIIAIFSAVLVALMVFIHGFSNFLIENTGIPKYLFIIFFLSFFLVFYIYHLVRASAFLSFNDEGSKIVLRFYRLDLFNSSKVSFEIPFSDFTGYKVEHRFFKFRESIVLFRMYQGNIVKYPSVPISALTKSERIKLLTTLNGYIPK